MDRDRDIRLDLRNLRLLNWLMKTQYAGWVSNAPREWRKDGFLVERVPVVVTSRYGHNQQMEDSSENMDEEADNWFRDRDWTTVRFLTVAVASHLWSVTTCMRIRTT